MHTCAGPQVAPQCRNIFRRDRRFHRDHATYGAGLGRPARRAGEVPAAPDPARPAGAAHGRAVVSRRARDRRRGRGRILERDPCGLRADAARLGAAVVAGPRLGRAGGDPQHRHERRPPCRGDGPRSGAAATRSTCASSSPTRCTWRASTPTRSRSRTQPTRAARASLFAYEAETDEPFPQDPARQLSDVLRSMARAWEGTSARLLRQAKGAPADAGLGLVVQAMALGLRRRRKRVGRDPVRRWRDRDAADHRALPVAEPGARRGDGGRGGALPARDPRGPSLEDIAPRSSPTSCATARSAARGCARRCRSSSRSRPGSSASSTRCGSRGRPRGGADRGRAGAGRDHQPQGRGGPARGAARAVRAAAPPGRPARRRATCSPAASRPAPARRPGGSRFTSRTAQRRKSREEPCILVRRETTPEDIRGMHASVGVLTERGGMTSHAAVIARGLGLPCVVGAFGLKIDRRDRTITFPDGRPVPRGRRHHARRHDGAGAGGRGGAARTRARRRVPARCSTGPTRRATSACAPTPTRRPRRGWPDFAAEGIGLCRTEHMFFADERLIGDARDDLRRRRAEGRAAVLERLLPMQRADFIELFEIMRASRSASASSTRRCTSSCPPAARGMRSWPTR
jgi:pyruvate, orthophosphate dikinase